jgi:predicted phage baseplate assembly protein
MPLQPPRLDDRDFESLFKEARNRIPRYVPEWTDWNDSDPGITLLQLQAWLAETILYRLNRLPDLNFVKFLQLLGVEQQPARPAQANLTFILKEKVGATLSEVLIERRTVVGVSLRDLEEPLYFETDRTLRAITATLDVLIYVPDIAATASSTDPERIPVLVTEDNNVTARTFAPFGDPAMDNAALVLAFKSSLPFPRDEVGLQFYLAEHGRALLANPPQVECNPEQQADQLLRWECWNGIEWVDLDLTGDETLNLTRSGQVFFKVPVHIPAVAYDSLGWPALATEDDTLYYWLRVVMDSADAYDKAPQVDVVLTNVVSATAALTVFDEAVGSSDGTPNQVMTLRHAPVLAEPQLVLEVDEGSGPQAWRQVTDFYGTQPDDGVYMLNRTTGEITFGDGLRGRIPVAGQFNVIAREYRYGGGRVGNVGSETITDLATPIAQVDSVTNYRPAEGGADEEPLEETKLRGPRDVLKTRDRAVTLEDFALLAAETPGALVARAHAYVATPPSTNGEACGRIINVVIVPSSEDAKPVPSETALDLICRYLDERRLITTQVCVRGAPYHDVDVALDVRARDTADLKTVKNAIAERLTQYFDPLRGGEDGEGWPFGRDVYYSELVREIMVLPGVLRVESLVLYKLLAYFDTESEAQAAMPGLIDDELAAFPDSCGGEGPVGTMIAIVESPESGDPPVQRWYVAAAYDCCDLPVAEGSLIALRQADIAISYARSRGVR